MLILKKEGEVQIPSPQPKDLSNRQTLSSFMKRTTPTKRSKTEAKKSYKKHCKSRKVNGRSFVPTKVGNVIMDGNWSKDLNKQKNFSLNRQAFAGQHGCFFKSEGKCLPSNFLCQNVGLYNIIIIIGIDGKAND